MTLAMYAVGKPYHPDVTHWPEKPALRFGPDGAELALFFNRPTAREAQAVRNDVVQFAWVDTEQGGLLCYRLGNTPWSDCSYTPQLDTDAVLPKSPVAGHLLVHLVLVDAVDGIIKAMRTVTWPPEFASAVAATVNRLADMPSFSMAAHVGAMDAIVDRYTSDQLVEQRADFRCTGGTSIASAGAGRDASPQTVAAPAGVAPATSGAADIMARVTAGLGCLPGKAYPTPLPAELEPWYCYVPDGGHSLVVVRAETFDPRRDHLGQTIPVPVKTVLNAQWEILDGMVVVGGLVYDPDYGLLVEDADEEF